MVSSGHEINGFSHCCSNSHTKKLKNVFISLSQSNILISFGFFISVSKGPDAAAGASHRTLHAFPKHWEKITGEIKESGSGGPGFGLTSEGFYLV